MNRFARVVVLTCLLGLIVFLGIYVVQTYAVEYRNMKERMKQPGVFTELINTTSKATQEIGEKVEKLKEMPESN